MRSAGAVAVAELLRCALAADDITDKQIEIMDAAPPGALCPLCLGGPGGAP